MLKKMRRKASKLLRYFLCFALVISTFVFAGPFTNRVSAAEPTIEDYWNGNAEFQIYYRENVPADNAVEYHNICGISMAVVDGIWYCFDRYLVSESVDKMGIHVRKSTDKGLTWSAPVNVVEPTPGTPWSRYATDGHAIYDAAANKWRLLFQSLPESGPWTCSYLERAGSDPMGPFTTPAGFSNPAINAKEIWSQIADNSSDHCVQITGGVNNVFDEGTPEIVDKVGNEYYVTFHGAANAGGTIRGFRGIAKTTDFQNYTPAASDCIFDEYDAQNWNVAWNAGGPVGGGHATYIKEGSYWYTIIECPDTSLGCTQGQNWPFGLLRSSSLTNTQWENFSNNPMPEFRSTGYICEWQYARFFKDNGT